MKKLLLLKPILLLFALIVGVGSAWAEDTTVSYGWETSDDATAWDITESIEATSGQGNTGTYAGKINTNNTYVQFKEKVYVKSFSFAFKRTSNNNNYNVYIETSTDGENWTAVETYAMSSFNNGSYTTKTKTFDGTKEYYVRFHCNNTTATRYVDDVTITYSNSAANPACAAPSFQPAAGLYSSPQNVTISSETPGAKIYYTMGDDPANPTINDTQYTATDPISVSSTTTIKAIAVAEGYENSAVVTAKYVFLEHAGTEADPYSVADARAAIDAGTGTQGVYATGVVSQGGTLSSGAISYYISVDGTTTADQLEAYKGKGISGADFTSADDIQVGDIVVIYGNLKKYNSTYEFDADNRLVSLIRPTIPIINADDVEIEYDAISGAIPYDITNPVEDVSLTATTTAEWISNVTVASDEVTFTTTANEGDADRTATITLSYEGAAAKTVTVTQKHFVIDYATLPFEWDGGASANLLALTGVTANGLGSDYGDNNAPYQVKLDGTGDYIQIKTDSQPDKVTVGVKMIGGNTTSKISVQESSDGTTFTDVEVLTISGTQNTELTLETTETFSTDTRYVRLLFTKGSNVGVGPITITKATNDPSISLSTSTIDAPASETEGTITVTYNNIASVDAEVLFYESDGVTPAEYSWLLADINNDNNIDYIIDDNNGEARTAYMKVHQKNTEVYSELITITQAKYVIDYATLPFEFNGGKAAIENKVGLTQSGLGSDYSTDNSKLKFDNTDDYLVLKINEAPGVLTFDIKGNSFSGGTFTVQSSADGTNYTDLVSYNELANSDETKLISGIPSEVRYIKWIYTNKVSGNVGLGNIKLDKILEKETVTVSDAKYATYSSPYSLDFSESGITVYTAKANGTSVKLTVVSDGIVPANTGVVLYSESAVTNKEVPVTTETGTADWSNNEMVANVVRAKVYLTEGDKTNYILSNEDDGVGFYKAAANGAYLPANRAYLSTTATATGNAPFLGFDGNETTGINSVERGALSVEGCYTLDGRRVAQPTKGLYIVNGRKVIIK